MLSVEVVKVFRCRKFQKSQLFKKFDFDSYNVDIFLKGPVVFVSDKLLLFISILCTRLCPTTSILCVTAMKILLVLTLNKDLQ